MALVPARYQGNVEFDRFPVPARIGLIVLATDHTSERDFARLVPPAAAGIYVSRLAYANPTTPENLARMQPRLTDAASLILPGEPLDAICYSCTAASVVIGDKAVEQAIASARPGVPVVTPPAAACTALRALGARNISILTPYVEETAAPVATYFVAAGFTVASLTCLGLQDDRQMARIRPATIVEAAAASTDDGAEAIFISCTALRAAEVAAEIEALTGRPVVTANLATVWMCLRLAGIARPIEGEGQLFGLALPFETLGAA